MQRKKNQNEDVILVDESTIELFEEAKQKASVSRHEAINNALDSAMHVVQEVLDDSDISAVGKMFAAKMALDAYGMQEKFKREDEKLRLDLERLQVEKAKLSVPGGPMYIFNQQNNINQQKDEKSKLSGKEAKKALQSRKDAQAAILEKISGVPQKAIIKKDDS